MGIYKTIVRQGEQVDATGLRVPAEVIDALGKGKRPPVTVTLNGYTCCTTLVVMGGEYWVPSAPNAAGLVAALE